MQCRSIDVQHDVIDWTCSWNSVLILTNSQAHNDNTSKLLLGVEHTCQMIHIDSFTITWNGHLKLDDPSEIKSAPGWWTWVMCWGPQIRVCKHEWLFFQVRSACAVKFSRQDMLLFDLLSKRDLTTLSSEIPFWLSRSWERRVKFHVPYVANLWEIWAYFGKHWTMKFKEPPCLLSIQTGW